MADGEIRISTRADNSKLTGDLRDAASKMKVLSNAFNDITKQIRGMESELAKTQAQYDALISGEHEPAELKNMAAELKAIQAETKAIEKENVDLIASYDKAIQKLEELRATGFTDIQLAPQIAEVDRLVEQLRPVWEQMDASEQAANRLQAAMEQIRIHPETSQEAQDLKTRVDALGKSIGEANTEAGELKQQINFQEAIANIQKFSAAATNLAKKIASIGIEAAKGLGTLSLHAARGAKGIGQIVLGLLGIRKHSRGASNGIRSLGNRLVRLAKNVFVFSVITSGLRKIREGVSALISTNTEMSASLNAISVNLMTAFSPIWEYIQPGLVSFLGVLERVTAAIATFFAMLGGQTYEQAKASAQALYEQAKATKEAGAEADKAKKKLAGFDKINQLTQETSEKGLDFGAVTAPDMSWLEDLIGRWYELGESLSDRLTDFLTGIDWGKIQNNARNLAQNIVDFINGFLDDPALWIAVGHTIAQGLNTALIFLDTLLAGLHWETFGRNFGMMLNTIVSEFDWSLLGKTMGDYVNAVFGFLLRAVETFDWANLGAKLALGLWSLTTIVNWDNIALTLAKGLNGVLLSLYTFLTSYDWGALGAKLASSLNLMISTIRWADIGATIAALFNSAISFLYNAVTDFKWGDVGAGLAAAINKLFQDVQWSQLGLTLSNFFAGVLDFINKVIRETDWKKIGEDIGTFIANIDWKGIAKAVAAVAAGAFGGFLDMVFGLIDKAPGYLITIGAIVLAISGLIKVIGGLLSIVVSLSNVIAAARVVMPLLSTAIKTVGGAFTALNPTVLLIGAAITALIAIIVLLVKNWDTVKEVAGKVWEGIKNIWGTASNWFQQKVWQPLMNGFKAVGNLFIKIWNGIVGAFENGINFIISGINGFIGAINKVLGGASDLLKNVGINVNVNIPNISKVSFGRIPALATGGIVDQATVAMIGERGREAVVPLDRDRGALQEIADMIFAKMNVSGNGGQPPQINIIAEGSEGELIRYFRFRLQEEDRRVGGSMSRTVAQF